MHFKETQFELRVVGKDVSHQLSFSNYPHEECFVELLDCISTVALFCDSSSHFGMFHKLNNVRAFTRANS